MDDSMDGIGRVESGTETEQLPRGRPNRLERFGTAEGWPERAEARLHGCGR